MTIIDEGMDISVNILVLLQHILATVIKSDQVKSAKLAADIIDFLLVLLTHSNVILSLYQTGVSKNEWDVYQRDMILNVTLELLQVNLFSYVTNGSTHMSDEDFNTMRGQYISCLRMIKSLVQVHESSLDMDDVKSSSDGLNSDNDSVMRVHVNSNDSRLDLLNSEATEVDSPINLEPTSSIDMDDRMTLDGSSSFSSVEEEVFNDQIVNYESLNVLPQEINQHRPADADSSNKTDTNDVIRNKVDVSIVSDIDTYHHVIRPGNERGEMIPEWNDEIKSDIQLLVTESLVTPTDNFYDGNIETLKHFTPSIEKESDKFRDNMQSIEFLVRLCQWYYSINNDII